MPFIEGRYEMQNVINKRNDEQYLIIFNVIGNKNNQTSVSNADREIQTLGSRVNLVSGIIILPSCWDFSVGIRDR